MHLNKSEQTGDNPFTYHDSNKQSGTGKKILLTILILDVFVVGGVILYAIKPSTYDADGMNTIFDYDENHIGVNSTKIPDTKTEMPTADFTTTSSTKEHESLILNEESQIRDTLTTYFDTLNGHATEDAINFFTDEVEILINYGKDYSYYGPKEGIMSYLTMAFDLDPDSKISEITISKIIISGDKATVQMNYIISSESYGFSMSIIEYSDLVKQNNEWKIKKTNITY